MLCFSCSFHLSLANSCSLNSSPACHTAGDPGKLGSSFRIGKHDAGVAGGPGALAPLPWLPCLPVQRQGPCVHLSSLHGHFSLFRCRGRSLLSGWEASGQTVAPSQRHPLLNLGCLWPATQSVGVTAPDKCCGFPSGCPQMSDPGGRRPPISAHCATPAGLGGDWGADGGQRALCPGSGQSLPRHDM